MNFFPTTLSFSCEKYKDIIIFDEVNSSLIKKVIPDNHSHSIYKTRPIKIAITFKIILNFFLNLKLIKIFEQFSSNKGFLKNILWQFLCIYIKSYIEIVKPKAVITSIDNCTKFAWLSKHIKNIPFIAIQNGFRLSYDLNNNLYHCQHLFCFGDFEVENFPKREWTVDNFYPVGSAFASMNFEDKYGDMIHKNEFDILVVSCWRGNIGFGQDVQDSMNAMRLFDLEFAAYLKKRNLKAAVILRSERNSDQWVMPEIRSSEEDYFKSIYEDTIEIIDTNFSIKNIYPLMEKSKMVISGFCSTSLLEAFGIGKKILYCDYTNQSKYFCDFDPAITFTKNKNSPMDTLEKRLDELIDMPSPEYKKCYSELMKYYQSSDKSIPTHEIIKMNIDRIIKTNENIKPL
jgi:hypothetical protein